MDTGIRPAGAQNFDLLAGHTGEDGFDFSLDG